MDLTIHRSTFNDLLCDSLGYIECMYFDNDKWFSLSRKYSFHYDDTCLPVNSDINN